jgi:hypothetical protein
MLTEAEIRAVAGEIVEKAKSTANIDTGFLKRSIYFTYVRGTVTFRQVFYGVYNKNSQLERYAKEMMPKGVPYILLLVNDDGTVFMEKAQTAGGRTITKDAIKQSNKQNTKNVYDLLKRINLRNILNGKKKT